MRIHHISCATMCPYGSRLIAGSGSLMDTACLCCHCLLLESDDGLVLVDTGLASADLNDGGRIPRSLLTLMRPVLDPAQSALYQIRALGYCADDVRHILLTHLDFDHAGGLADFPKAKVHVFADEHAAGLKPRTLIERSRYLRYAWSHQPDWAVHHLDGERWEGFAGVRALGNSETDILLVPTAGHTRGHCAIAVRDGAGWLLHCGDAYFFRDEMETPPSCTPGLNVFQRLIAHDNGLRLENQRRLRSLKREEGDRIRLFCAHDPVELDRYRAAAAA
jgi:glyoxylase-like metal-dependent hydrolase (beta-lactamase superfamily II)